ncbi:MAG: methionine--tRNA ligase [Proteobacteria bacterium]|nr:methionine--tRNA ligase [Pseudomonadota bacterium]
MPEKTTPSKSAPAGGPEFRIPNSEFRQRHLITSALPYVNGVKHLGNLIGSLLPSDVFARYLRAQGHEVLLICATDDHGTPAEIAALKAKQPVAQFCAEQHEVQKRIYQNFGLSFNHFGATSRPQNHVITQRIARSLWANGMFEVKAIKQVYSKADARFLPDRYVEGTCPHCGYTKARGDQCENCTRVLDPTDLISPRSAISGSTELEVRETKHAFLKLSTMAEKLRTWVNTQKDWPNLTRSIALKWLDEGLNDRGMTRDLKWGVPVPEEFGPEFKDKVFYVWFDAPIGYIGATAEWADLDPKTRNWESWWLNANDVTYTEFMGKDNVPFHTIIFPAMLMGSGEPWKLVDQIKSFSWMTYYGGKFSTSSRHGVFTDQALEEIPNADYWRYYLLARAPESDDSAFTWADFQAVVNKDLADVLGNFVNRTLQLTAKHFGATIPEAEDYSDADMACAKRLDEILARYTAHMEKAELRKAVEALRELWVAGNEYLASQEPWQLVKTDKPRAAAVLKIAINMIPMYARAMAPIIPFSAAKLMALFPNPQAFIKAPGSRSADGSGLEQTRGTHPASGTGPIPAPHLPASLHTAWLWPSSLSTCAPATGPFTLPTEVLFPKITDEQREAWEAKYGNQKA